MGACVRFFSKQGLLGPPRWNRVYFFTQGGNLMSQNKGEVRRSIIMWGFIFWLFLFAIFQIAGQLVLDLNEEGVFAEVTDIDDRRNVFHIVAPQQKKWSFGFDFFNFIESKLKHFFIALQDCCTAGRKWEGQRWGVFSFHSIYSWTFVSSSCFVYCSGSQPWRTSCSRVASFAIVRNLQILLRDENLSACLCSDVLTVNPR